MTHQASQSDVAFREAFERCEVSPQDFDHKAHVRLAYVYLCECEPTQAAQRMKQALLAFLKHLGVDSGKFHETLTGAWIDAVRHFMVQSPESNGFDQFIGSNPALLDSRIMLTHYSAELLFSDQARADYVEPDVQPIPRY